MRVNYPFTPFLISFLITDQADVTDDKNFYDILASHVQISSIETSLNGHIRSRKTAPIDPQTLAARWMISLERVKRTIVMTMQRGVRICLYPTLSPRFPTNDQMLRYKHVMHTMFNDMLFNGSISWQGNQMAQAYATSFGWARAHPMKRKGDTHETLSIVFQRDGVPPTMVTNDSKEQTKGEFRRKIKEADCHPRVTEPYSPWQQAAEGCICELKRGSSRKKWLRPDHSNVCGTTALSLRNMSALAQAMTFTWLLAKCLRPETIMTENTANISHIAEFGWYDWVMFCDNKLSFPNDKLILGHYLGPAIDTGLALTAIKRCVCLQVHPAAPHWWGA